LGAIVDRCYRIHGPTETAEMLDRIKALGYKYSTKAAITVSVSDMEIPSAKAEILAEAEKNVDIIEKQYRRGLISAEERYERIIDEWNAATEKVGNALMENLDEFNPIFMMANSGARGSRAQITQLAGMRGLMANPTGKIIEMPIKANFREGLSALEFFISTHGARKGLADTALRTADSGYLTRRLVDVSQDVIIREDDCGTDDGIYAIEFRDGNEVIEKLEDRIIGRVAAEDVIHPETGEILVAKNQEIKEKTLKELYQRE
jgi:DNA-directed RNA polymerase subunit beta' (EC 2.7.7.6)